MPAVRRNQLLSTQVAELGLSVRATEHLESRGILRVDDLVKLSEQEVLAVPGITARMAEDLLAALHREGIVFGD